MRRLLFAAAALGCAALAASPRPEHPQIALRAAHGAVRVENSRDGRAIIAAGNLRPGQTVTGSVSVTNSGEQPARLLLRSSLPRGVAGPYGGRLGDVLRVRIEQHAARDRTIAKGRLVEVAGCHDLGKLAPGRTRTYAMTATFPRGDRRDNRYARARVTVDERWTASAADCRGRVPKPPPKLELLISHRRVLVRHGRARVKVICHGTRDGRCRGWLKLRPTNLASRLEGAAAGVRFDAPAGGTDTIMMRIPRASERRMRRRGKAVALALIRPAPGSPMAAARRYITLIGHNGSR
jgi:spore coat-associated protein N